MVVAIFGIAAALGIGYPAGAKSTKGRHAHCAEAAKSKARHAKRRPKCKKPKPMRRGTGGNAPAGPTVTAPTKTLPVEVHPPGSAPVSLAATLVVRVYGVGTLSLRHGADCAEEGLQEGVRTKRPSGGEWECKGHELTSWIPIEGVPLVITRLGVGGAGPSTFETSNHTVQVAPGLYEIALNDPHQIYKKPQVTVSEGQTVEVSLEIL
jgi:hypothetical protein